MNGDAAIARDSHNSAPALSNDQTTLYVAVKSATSDVENANAGVIAAQRQLAAAQFLSRQGVGLLTSVLENVQPDCVDHQILFL